MADKYMKKFLSNIFRHKGSANQNEFHLTPIRMAITQKQTTGWVRGSHL
jgi:hypothetical protein